MKNLLVTFHPVTLEKDSSKFQMIQLLSALENLSGISFIFTMPNADTDGRILFNLINKFVKKNHNSVVFKSLGQKRYFLV